MMRGFAVWLLIAAALAGCAEFPAAGRRSEPTASGLSRQLLITMSQDRDATFAVRGDPASFYLRRRGYGPTASVDRALDQIADDYGIRRVEGWYISSISEYCEVYELGPGQSLPELIERIGADPRVELVQEMNLFETEAVIYDDPYAPMQPALSTLSIQAAHAMATGRGVSVAVIDSSVDRHHDELKGQIRLERNLVRDRAYRDAEVHGTAVAGIIGSSANNGEGIVGVAPDSSIVALRACWTVESATGRAACSSFSLAQALESAMLLDVDVINLSLAGPSDPLLGALLDAAVDSGIIVVAAEPTARGVDNAFPSSHPGVIAVRSAEAPIGPAAPNLLRAPGAEVLSTTPNNGYAFFSGNSMSAAYVSGVSALVREHRPTMRPGELIKLLSDTGEQQLVNACRAIVTADGYGSCDDDIGN